MRCFDLERAVASLKPKRRLPLPPHVEISAWSVATILRPAYFKQFPEKNK